MSALPAELGFATIPGLLASNQPLGADGVLDLSGVSQTDSAGVALLLEFTRRARGAGRTLEVRNAPPRLRELCTFYGVDSLLKFT